MAQHTTTYTATNLLTCRNGTSWRGDFPKAGQGRTPTYDDQSRVGYIEFGNMNLSGKLIESISLTFSYSPAGIGNHTSKTLGFYKWQGSLRASGYTSSNLLGTLSSKNQYSGSTTFSITGDLLTAFKNYFEAGNKVLIICRPDDKRTHSYDGDYTDNYLLVDGASITITYHDLYAFDVKYKLNGSMMSNNDSSVGTFSGSIGGETFSGKTVLSKSVPSGTTYSIKPVNGSGYKLKTSSPVSGTTGNANTEIIIEFNQLYTIEYDIGYSGGTDPSDQTKEYGEPITLAGNQTRANTALESYKVRLHDGEDIDELYASRYTSYSFNGWKKSDGTILRAGSSYTTNQALSLTGSWNSTPNTNSINLPVLSKPGYSFIGWSTTESGVSLVSSTYQPSQNTDLYAVWSAEGLVMIDDGVSFNPYTMWIDNGSGWSQYMAYIDTGTSWVLCNE